MTLTLTILRCPQNVTPEMRRVTGGEFAIGRGSESDWVLPDPEKHLSRRHCVLRFRNGQWQVVGSSTNGTFLNSEVVPLESRPARTLEDRDRLRFGAYEIEVRLAPPETQKARGPAPRNQKAKCHPFGDDPLGHVSLPTDRSDQFAPPAPRSREDKVATAPKPATSAPDTFGAFLRGAGMPDARAADAERAMEDIGAAFRAVVYGVRRALIARAGIKREFRIEATEIRARGNNLLKFSANDDDALAGLLGAGRRTDMTPEEAVADALADIRLHELATIVAMQSAVRSLVAQLGPEQIWKMAETGGGVAWSGARKARAWDVYRSLHDKISEGLSDDFDSVFGKSFARAYEQAIQELNARQQPDREEQP
jgi:predicted component of type VI protein secretion system